MLLRCVHEAINKANYDSASDSEIRRIILKPVLKLSTIEISYDFNVYQESFSSQHFFMYL